MATTNSMQILTEDSNSTEQGKTSRQQRSPCRCLSGVLLSLMIVTVVVILILLVVKKTSSDEPTENPEDVEKFSCELNSVSKTTEMKINTPISFTCQYPTSDMARYLSNSRLLVTFNPNYNLTKESVELNTSLQNPVIKQGPWHITTSGHIELRGNPVECGQDGIYNVTLQTPIASFNFIIKLDIDKETTPVEFKITKAEKEDKFMITCSYTRVCEPTCIILMGIKNSTLGPLPHVEFNCSRPVDGYVNCRGNISGDVTQLVDKITCRPNITNETEANNLAANLSKDEFPCNADDCGNFTCPKQSEHEYYTDPKLCRIFHQCVNGELSTSPCAMGTYFDTKYCTCGHIRDVIAAGDCNSDGLRLKTGNKKILCRAKDHLKR